MRYLSRILWILPLTFHVGYALATFPHFNDQLGQSALEQGTSVTQFFLIWFVVIGAANASLVFVHLRLPHFSDRMLSVPGRDYWLKNERQKALLVDHLAGVCEVALLALNVFFLAVYQIIYQSNAPTRVFHIRPGILIFFYMAIPVIGAIGYVIYTMIRLKRRAQTQALSNHKAPDDRKDNKN